MVLIIGKYCLNRIGQKLIGGNFLVELMLKFHMEFIKNAEIFFTFTIKKTLEHQ
jgi:hypothetical protein